MPYHVWQTTLGVLLNLRFLTSFTVLSIGTVHLLFETSIDVNDI